MEVEIEIYELLTESEVEMAGYWPNYFFALLWTETKSRSIKTEKKERGSCAAILTSLKNKIKVLS